jgi:hypothetical protein
VVKRPKQYMATITERTNVMQKQHNVSVDAGRGRSKLIQPRRKANNPENYATVIKTVRHYPQTTQESEPRSHRYSQSK